MAKRKKQTRRLFRSAWAAGLHPDGPTCEEFLASKTQPKATPPKKKRPKATR